MWNENKKSTKQLLSSLLFSILHLKKIESLKTFSINFKLNYYIKYCFCNLLFEQFLATFLKILCLKLKEQMQLNKTSKDMHSTKYL